VAPYLDAWKRLQHYIVAGKRSPIAVASIKAYPFRSDDVCGRYFNSLLD